MEFLFGQEPNFSIYMFPAWEIFTSITITRLHNRNQVKAVVWSFTTCIQSIGSQKGEMVSIFMSSKEHSLFSSVATKARGIFTLVSLDTWRKRGSGNVGAEMADQCGQHILFNNDQFNGFIPR